MASNLVDLTGSTVMITGASSGIGRETAILFSCLGARLVLTGRNRERLECTLSSLEGEGHRIEAFDLGRLADIPQWLRSVAAETGAFHGLVHAAGVQLTAPIRFIKPEDADNVLRTNLLSAIMLMRGFSQKGCHTPGSSVVFLSSIVAFSGRPALSAYSASKAALIGLTKSLAIELAPQPIRVNCIAPGYVKTEMLEQLQEFLPPQQLQELERAHPLGFGTPRDVANAAAFLVANSSRWITGTTLVVDGGYSAQ